MQLFLVSPIDPEHADWIATSAVRRPVTVRAANRRSACRACRMAFGKATLTQPGEAVKFSAWENPNLVRVETIKPNKRWEAEGPTAILSLPVHSAGTRKRIAALDA